MTKKCQESTTWESPKANGAEPLEEPSDGPMSYEEQRRGLPVWARGLIVLALIALLVFGLSLLRTEKDTSMDLKKLNLPSQAEVSRISVSTNPAYQEKLEAYTQSMASAITHLLAGIVCVNIVTFARLFGATAGGIVEAVIESIFS